MKHSDDDRDPVWELLERARPDQIQPQFTQNVLREVRRLEGGAAGAVRAWLRAGGWLRTGSALAAAAVLLLGGFFLLKVIERPPTSAVRQAAPIADSAHHQEEISIEEFEAELDELVYMEELMGVSDTSLLADEDLAALLF